MAVMNVCVVGAVPLNVPGEANVELLLATRVETNAVSEHGRPITMLAAAFRQNGN